MMSQEDEDSAKPTIADLFRPDSVYERVWTGEELGAILKHQLRAPLQLDLRAIQAQAVSRITLLAEVQGLMLKSFNDLFAHPNPPVQLLVLVKEFAKENALHPLSVVPNEVARVLYFLAIASARVSCDARITSNSDADAAAGIRGVLELPWIGDFERRLLQRAMNTLSEKGSTTPIE